MIMGVQVSKQTETNDDKKLVRATGRLLKQAADTSEKCVLCGLPEDKEGRCMVDDGKVTWPHN